jgi:CheY-like chemotaxis protein
LIVDDNLDAAHSLTVLLGLLGHEVRKAHEGEQALAVAAEFVPEFVLLDIGLPGMSGHEVALEFRSRPAFRSVRLIALTGYGTDEDRRRSRLSGFHHHLVKPLDLAALQSLLAETPSTSEEGPAEPSPAGP